MSDQPDTPEDDKSASADASVPEPEILKAEDVHLADPDVSGDAVEPTLNTSAEDVRLIEPSLGAAEISGDAAEAASLDDAAAEAAQVAKEAEDVGTLVAGPRPTEDPAEAAAPAGTAPAGGAAGDAPPGGLTSFAASGTEPAWTGPGSDEARWDALFDAGQADASAAAVKADEVTTAAGDPQPTDPTGTGTGAGTETEVAAEPGTEEPEATSASSDSAAPEAPWAQPFASGQPQAPGSPVPPVGGPYGLPPAGGDDPAPTRIRARSAGRSSRGGSRKKLIILGVAGLVVLALLIFAIASIVNALGADTSDAASSASTTPGADGIIAEGISPLELVAGDCILGFDSTDLSADVTTVTCTTPHNAQLLATTSFPEDSEFPGEAALNASGDDLCNSVAIDENAAAEYAGLTLTQVTPTSGTWADGDRRIDCFVVSDEGNVITDTLLAG
ncbi:hypothetical protein GCM10009784_04770 [Arthrobacter parietis]|uniref:Septum formation-related domain-containing protein n=2 Tax=Arthrobacter TaxID=1663 RepID=A0ABN3APW3_9MICC